MVIFILHCQVSQLEKAGVSAIRVCNKTQCQDVAAGKFRFGLFWIYAACK